MPFSNKVVSLAGIFLGTFLVEQVAPANILVISFFSSKSHKLTYMPLIEELGKRGHNITIISPIKASKELKNVREIFTFDTDSLLFQSDKYNVFDRSEKKETNDFGKIFETIYLSCEKSFDLPQVRFILNEKFDLVFLQPLFNDCALGIIYRLQVPFVLFTPTYVPPYIVNKIGGYLPPSVTPNILTGFPQGMGFYQRFISFGIDTILGLYMEWFYLPKVEEIYRGKLGQDIPSVTEIMGNASIVLSNSHFSLIGPNPYFPDVVEVGGIHSRPAKPIPKDLESFIKKGKDGFILFSMGSTIKGDLMPEAKRKMILNVFSKLKQQVIWKWESETMPDLPKNVKLGKWLPQQDLLGHKDIKMFITHCGGGSIEESIYHKVPLVGIPMLGDQLGNADLAKKYGFLVKLDWNNLTEEVFSGAIQEILNKPEYTNNVKGLSALFSDRPINPLDLGVYWIEYIIRHKGAPHLKNAGRKLDRLQYHSVDVIATYVVLISLTMFLIYTVLKVTTRKLCRFSPKIGYGKKIN